MYSEQRCRMGSPGRELAALMQTSACCVSPSSHLALHALQLCSADGSGDLRRVLSSSPYQAPASQYITRSISRSRGTPLSSLGATLSAAAGIDRELSRGQPSPQASSLGPASPAARRSASTGRAPHASTERAASRGRGPLAQGGSLGLAGDRLDSHTQAAFAEQLASRAARDASRGRARGSIAPAGRLQRNALCAERVCHTLLGPACWRRAAALCGSGSALSHH